MSPVDIAIAAARLFSLIAADYLQEVIKAKSEGRELTYADVDEATRRNDLLRQRFEENRRES